MTLSKKWIRLKETNKNKPSREFMLLKNKLKKSGLMQYKKNVGAIGQININIYDALALAK